VPEPYRRKLIEVALPLEAINRESQHEKDVKVGKPTSVHHWWARRPLAASRAVLFASLIDDPSSRPDEFPTEGAQEDERQRLFRIIEDLVKWENSNNETVLEAARVEIIRSTGGHPPSVLDPFCGGGSIPLEAQRLGLDVRASELNPIAVLITKAMVEIPPKFTGRAPVNPQSRSKLGHEATWKGVQGLAEDVRYYGGWMRDVARERLGNLYPRATRQDGSQAQVIAWLWARIVECPNPVCGASMPLVRSFTLSAKKGNEWHLAPLTDREANEVRYEVRRGGAASPGSVGRRGATCLVCEAPVDFDYLRAEGRANRIGARLMAIVAEGTRGRVYLPADDEHELAAAVEPPTDVPDTDMPAQALGFRVQGYGMTKHRHLFTPRQLVALTTLSDLVASARERVLADSADGEYADALATYLALAVDRVADWGNSLSRWENKAQVPQQLFGRQTLSMSWDYAEANPLSESTGSLQASVVNVARSIDALPASRVPAEVAQLDAAQLDAAGSVVCTDPPYYDNVPYADLSDFFYVWLRRSMGSIYPDLFSTLLTPKAQELVADAHRFGGNNSAAREFFEDGMARFFSRVRETSDPDYPTTLFYAFKQAESQDGSTASTGWETMLSGLVQSGFAVTGTWPMRTEMSSRMRGQNANALASSIVLVCRPRPADASITTRREFVAALKAELPAALRQLQHGSIAPVDLAQAAIGPGMAVFSRHAKVVEANGEAMTVRTALGLINEALDEILAQQEGDFDPYTRFAVSWFKEYGFGEGEYGRAETLATARAVSVDGVVRAGILHSRANKVRLLRRGELDPSWDPASDSRPTVWEAAHHLVERLDAYGESSAAELLRRLGGYGETARELAHVLYSVCDRKGWAQEALDYNALGTAWRDIAQLAAEQGGSDQQSLGV
jgi:putative DNA methylase